MMRDDSRERFAAGRLAVGTRLGKYEILRFIAEGGMGELYVARASGGIGRIEGFEKTVALKRILARFASREQHVKMFLDEAKLAATLHHPNIVQVFDIGDECGVLFFSMEYVHGTDVRTLLDAAEAIGEPLPLESALEIVLAVAAGLHHAHQAGVIHRDVSPSNVLVAHDGGVKVTDFGVAKMEHTGDTKSGLLKGKVAYMSPEQCRGDVVDRRSDVFSIGILLYELTTLVKPFTGSTEFATMEHIVHRDAEPPTARDAAYPPELAAIVMRALRRDRDERYATAQELQRELRAFTRDRRLDVSPLALESYLRARFGGRVDAWRDAEVQSSLPLPTAVTVRERPDASPADATPVPVRRPRWPIAAVASVALAGGGVWAYSAGSEGEPMIDGKVAPAIDHATPRVGSADAQRPREVRTDPVQAPAEERVEPVIKPPRGTRTGDLRAVPPVIDRNASKAVVDRRVGDRPPIKRVPPTQGSNEPPKGPTEPQPAKQPPATGSGQREIPWDPDSPTFPKKL